MFMYVIQYYIILVWYDKCTDSSCHQSLGSLTDCNWLWETPKYLKQDWTKEIGGLYILPWWHLDVWMYRSKKMDQCLDQCKCSSIRTVSHNCSKGEQTASSEQCFILDTSIFKCASGSHTTIIMDHRLPQAEIPIYEICVWCAKVG